jgi:hypothetical protein
MKHPPPRGDGGDVEHTRTVADEKARITSKLTV